VVVYDLSQAFFPLPPVRCAGTLVPVFSLRSRESFGVGDFGDLKKMIDWVAKTKQRVLQILPINDTTITHTWTDSYPYSCISIFALHPQYADLNQLPKIADKALADEMEQLRQELNALPQIDYERVNDAKVRYLRAIYEQEGKTTLASTEFKQFFKETEQWLVPYAQYCFLRDTNGTADFLKWEGHTSWNEDDRAALSNGRTKAYRDVAFYYFVQFILSEQMKAAHEYARANHVILKGDIPIGVNRFGCDVWSEPRYFNLNGQAGAPPDDFSVNGQNWGFPTYNWDEMIADGCQWWVRRFQNMQQYFDAYRIDHVLGFFRIWEIPATAVHGLLGHFSPALGMSREEIEGYGLHWQEDLFTTPFITDWVLDRVFHERAQEVREKYVEPKWEGHYRMRPEFDTQKKIEAAFEGCTEERDIWLRDGLYSLVSDVLFVRDHKDSNKFHPRISVQFDFIYENLYDSDKAIFNRLYNDYFYRRNNQFWYHEAMKKLPLLVNATRMLVCAEDLGMVPDCVEWVMNELRILSLELQSMPKDPKVRFGYLSRNPYRSVCTISSHDMPTLRQWWDENWERTQAYYNTMLHRGDAAPHPLPGWLARDILSRNLYSPSMLCIISIQDWMAMDENLRLDDPDAERINIPANPKHYWRYRMHVNLEDLMENQDFNGNMIEMITNSGRN
jgi:4-alpha-glucanotransferase